MNNENKEQEIAENEEYAIDSVITRNGTDFAFDAVNTYVDLLQNVTVIKQWVGVSHTNIPDKIYVNLYRHVEGKAEELVYENVEMGKNSSINTWYHTFANLPVYKAGGEEEVRHPYIYTVKEMKVGDTVVTSGKAGDYTVVESGLHITNTLGGTVDGATLDATKVWEGVTGANIPDINVTAIGKTIRIHFGTGLSVYVILICLSFFVVRSFIIGG